MGRARGPRGLGERRRLGAAARFAALLALALPACGPSGPEAGAGEAAAGEQVVSRLALGTLVSVVVRDPDTARGRAATERAFAEIERLEGLLSEWREQSEISRLNAGAGGPLQPVSADTRDLLVAARRLAEESGGAFDPTTLPLVRLWGFAGGEPRVPSAPEIEAARRLVGWEAIELDASGTKARLAAAGAAIGLGAIGKGFIADRVLAGLRRDGVPAAMVRASGDLAFYGGTADRPWPVGVEDPAHPGEILAELDLLGGGVSTSAPTWRRFEADGRVQHHILDPRTGSPARGARSVTVVAPDATRSDAFSTALFVLGSAAPEFVRAHPGIEAVILLEDGTRWASPGLAVRWREPLP